MSDDVCGICGRAIDEDHERPLRICRDCGAMYCADCGSDHHEICRECAAERKAEVKR